LLQLQPFLAAKLKFWQPGFGVIWRSFAAVVVVSLQGLKHVRETHLT
jgi:hypothetical protein